MSDFIPVLSAGKHGSPSQGACVMEMVSFMSGGEWTDYPECTEPGIARLAQLVNDYLQDSDRHLVLQHFDRLFGTALDGDIDEHKWQQALYNKFHSYGVYRIDNSIIIMNNFFYRWANTRVEEIVSKDGDLTFGLTPEFAQEAIDLLGEVLDLFDETFGRKNVEKQDVSKLAELPSQVKV